MVTMYNQISPTSIDVESQSLTSFYTTLLEYIMTWRNVTKFYVNSIRCGDMNSWCSHFDSIPMWWVTENPSHAINLYIDLVKHIPVHEELFREVPIYGDTMYPSICTPPKAYTICCTQWDAILKLDTHESPVSDILRLWMRRTTTAAAPKYWYKSHGYFVEMVEMSALHKEEMYDDPAEAIVDCRTSYGEMRSWSYFCEETRDAVYNLVTGNKYDVHTSYLHMKCGEWFKKVGIKEDALVILLPMVSEEPYSVRTSEVFISDIIDMGRSADYEY